MGVFIGITIGLVLGLTGAGGSLFAVPMLMLLVGLPFVEATGIALGAVSVSAAFGITRQKMSDIAWVPAIVIMLAGALSTPVGRIASAEIAETELLIGFSLLVVFVAVEMWRQAVINPQSTTVIRATESKHEANQKPYCRRVNGHWQIGVPCVIVASVGGALAGFLSGVFGVGGGFLIVPLLTLVAGLSMQQAVSTSLLIIAVISSIGLVSHINFHGAVNLEFLSMLAIGGVIGMLIGMYLGQKIAGPMLQKLFSILLLATLLMLWSRV